MIQNAKTRDYNRRTTLANELDFPDADAFFSNGEFEGDPSFILEHSDEDISPKQTPRQRTNTITEHLMSLDSGSNETSSFMKRRLVAGVRYNKGLKSKFNKKDVGKGEKS